MILNSFKTDAIVLSKKKLKNKDLAINLYTKEKGKLFCIAKGINSIKSKRSPSYDTLNFINVSLNDSKGFIHVGETYLYTSFNNVKKHPKSIHYSYFLLESFSYLIPDEEKDLRTFMMLKNTLVSFNDSLRKSIVICFLRDLLLIQGFISEEDENRINYLIVQSSKDPSKLNFLLEYIIDKIQIISEKKLTSVEMLYL